MQFDVNVANGAAIEAANDILIIRWIKVNPKRFIRSKSLLHANIK